MELGSKLEKLGGRLDALEPRENNKAGKDEPNLSQLLDPKYEIDQIYQKKLRGVITSLTRMWVYIYLI